jgi:hypothetical protein
MTPRRDLDARSWLENSGVHRLKSRDERNLKKIAEIQCRVEIQRNSPEVKTSLQVLVSDDLSEEKRVLGWLNSLVISRPIILVVHLIELMPSHRAM